MDEARVKIVEDNPIGNGLDAFRALFASVCESQGLVSSPDALDQLDRDSYRDLAFQLLVAVQLLKAARLLRSAGSGKYLLDDILRLTSAVNADDFDHDRLKPLFRAVLDVDGSNDVFTWTQVYSAVTEATSPPQPRWSSVTDTPITRNTSSILNSSELRREVDQVLKEELDPRVGIRNFRQAFFASVPNLEAAADFVFHNIIPKLESLAAEYTPSNLTQRRKLLAQSTTPLLGSTGKRSMDVGFVNDDFVPQPHLGKSGRYRWSHVLVPGELKSNPKADAPPLAWIDLATYAREVLSAQDARRFVLAFSLCGSIMRLWEYDRIGGIASEQYDINKPKGGVEFVATMLGFLWVDEERLGFDPTIVTSDGKRFIEIERNGQPERLIVDEGRAATCWKAHREGDSQTTLVIKDSWQYPERDEEGEIIQEATERGAINVARYYYHETVRIRGIDDDVSNSTVHTVATADTTVTPDTAATPDSTATTVIARRASIPAIVNTLARVDAVATVGSTATPVIARRASTASTIVDAAAMVDATDAPDSTATDDTTATTMIIRRSSTTSTSTAFTIAAAASNRRRRSTAQRGRATPRVQQLRQSESRSSSKNNSSGNSDSSDSIGTGGAGTKRRSSTANEADAWPAKRSRTGSHNASVDKTTPSNRVHRRIIVQDYGRPIYKASSPAALVAALESCIRGHESLRQAGFLHRDISVNNGKTGTRAFMAIGLLFGEQHCFMHDLESFFWVLFWVCVNYDGPGMCVKKNPFDSWNYSRDYDLAGSKLGVITDSHIFRRRAAESFTPFYEPLIPLMDRLREVVFPDGVRWKRVDEGLYSAMRAILRDEKS
ncbi:hypothetical protein V8C42DRAFT_351903 [Trichoderma barbatum]